MKINDSNKNEDEQLAMAIPSSRFERFYRFKRKVESVEESIKFVPINRTVSFWIILIFSIFTALFIAFSVIRYYGELPNLVPLLFSQIDSSWIILPKQYLLIYIVVPLVNIVILITFIRSAYLVQRRLTTAIMIIMNISNILILIAILQIISFSIV
ncbi:MAG: hypothetical protein WCK31_05055 [bacterium]